MTDNNDALLREVDEELRREQMAKLWERYGSYILGAAALIVAVVGGYKIYEQRQLAFAQENGSRYAEALQLAASGKADDATKALDEIAASGHTGYAALAQLQRAGAELKAGKPKEALAIFEKLEALSGLDAMTKGFVQLQIASLKLGDADFTEIQNRLTELSKDNNPWRHNARELVGLAAVKAGKSSEASKAFEQILADRAAPSRIVERARVMMGTLAAAAMGAAAGVPASPSSSTAAPAAASPAAPAADATAPSPAGSAAPAAEPAK